ncbi:MAG: four helix bundle protein [Rhizomicrobium sp.]
MENTEAAEQINSYRDLRVWQDAMTLAESCYVLTAKFPREELFSLTSQIRRAATSISANIAEGHGRESTGSFIQFLRISQGSLKELETLLTIAHRVKITDERSVSPLLKRCDALGRMLRALIRSLQAKNS